MRSRSIASPKTARRSLGGRRDSVLLQMQRPDETLPCGLFELDRHTRSRLAADDEDRRFAVVFAQVALTGNSHDSAVRRDKAPPERARLLSHDDEAIPTGCVVRPGHLAKQRFAKTAIP